MKKFSKGFTIVELLVVIAIIAVLAAIVLVNVTQYIAKGKVAAIKGNMDTILTNAAVFYDGQTPNTYVNFNLATEPTFNNPATAIANAGGSSVATLITDSYASSTTFCACTNLPPVSGSPDLGYCVDSTGNKLKLPANCASTDCSSTQTACK